MSEAKLAGKVGLFVVAGIGLVVGLVFIFSKGLASVGDTYELRLRVRNVAGLTEHSSVLMSGVKVGAVRRIELGPGGKGVILHAEIGEGYQIHADAQFVIEQIGFLGDQYVSIYPRANEGPILGEGSEVEVEQPVNMQQAARSAVELVGKVAGLVDNANRMVERVSSSFLNEPTLTNAASAVINLREFSDRALDLIGAVDGLLVTNSPAISVSVSNLVRFSEELKVLAGELSVAVSTNRGDFRDALRNVEETSRIMKGMVEGIEAGEGVVGSLLRDKAMQGHLAQTVSNLNVLSSNLTRYGLLYKPKKRKEEQPSGRSIYPGRTP